MTGRAECTECEEIVEVTIPPEHRNPTHRAGFRTLLENTRKSLALYHRRRSTCKGVRFDITFTLEPRAAAPARPLRSKRKAQ